jgi:hypothetical protein
VTFQDKKKNCFILVFLLITLEGTIASFFKEKKSQRSHKTVERKVFLTILLDEGRIRILPLTNESGPDPGGPQTYGSGFGTLYSACVLCRQPLIYIFMSVSFFFDHQIEEIKTETHPFCLAVMLRIENGMSEPGGLHVS